ncbi:Flp pilus assembly protein CpaB [Ketobacter sp. MCCC 1A13808]|uniref:Flp pilus assembly protein CpaB n=1 Tax=Ketobacter sp. MCCC 1A13808 TaxID=2602738 RepID=UPI0012EB187F|nr:Flp pilus assembly protein CpaB [Ketobacter sp. MCCC 1A13808]MVF12531.1 Flp pilus assembly protein CpaB [Ketobacter sp. MCCC 1A13808]
MKSNNKTSILLLLCALLAGGAGWYLSTNHIDQEIKSYKSSFEAERESIEVVVASRDLKVGDTVSAQTASIRKIPKIYVPADAATPAQFSQIEGMPIIHPVKSGEPILSVHVSTSKVEGLSSLLKEGERAITIPVSSQDTFSGFLAPGDTIDLMITLKDGEDSRTVPLAQNLRVLATGSDLDDGVPEVSKRRYSEITLGVSPLYATRLIHAQSVGDITLLMRRAEDGSDRFEDYVTLDNLIDIPQHPKPVKPTPPPQQDGYGFELIRGGKRS